MAAYDHGGGRESTGVTMRTLRPSDHGTVIAVVDAWWGGRPMAAMLPAAWSGAIEVRQVQET